ncbi:hypothetical protein [Marinimicrobium sp. ARAG 43.8]|uniref:hypothetical protein n=1 Tax=Marinimicrobium sp. ARAG 43.8 TaxID=3418719 RepID=UPI003CE92C48
MTPRATTLTRYLGSVERITHPDGRLEIKRRLPGGALISYTRSADGLGSSSPDVYFSQIMIDRF